MEIKNPKKSHPLFECVLCDYITSSKKDYTKHLSTRKHSDRHNGNNWKSSGNPKNPLTRTFFCNCMRDYKTLSGLWKHKKICQFSEKECDDKINDQVNQITPELVLSVLKQNTDLTSLLVEQNKTIMELSKSGPNQTIMLQNVNNNNKTFNLNVFLNETCKDAMNITDFVDSLHLQISDLENVGKVGFVEGISNIIVKNLQAMDVHKRPVHCADKKREVIYIKDEDKWERDTDEKNKLRKVIKRVAIKNQNLLSKFKLEHPGCNYSESKYADQYSKLVIEAMGGVGDNDIEKEDKIIKNIAKEVVIDKKDFL